MIVEGRLLKGEVQILKSTISNRHSDSCLLFLTVTMQKTLEVSHSGLKSVAVLDSAGRWQLFRSVAKWSITFALVPILVTAVKMLFGVRMAQLLSETDWPRFALIVVGFGALGALLRLLSILEKRKIVFTEDFVEVHGPTEHRKYPRKEIRSLSLTNAPLSRAILLNITIGDLQIRLVSRADFDHVRHSLEALGYPASL